MLTTNLCLLLLWSYLFRISVLSTPVERERLAFVREEWSALMTMDVTLMTLDSVVRPSCTCTFHCIHQLKLNSCYLYS